METSSVILSPQEAAAQPISKPKRHRTARDPRLLYACECDRMYRMRKGTTAMAARQGKLPFQKRGRRFLVSAKRAAELWGAE